MAKTIIWDIDDVLNSLTHDWLVLEWLPKNPTCKISYSEISQNPPHSVLGISSTTYLNSLDAFRIGQVGRHLEPSKPAMEWFCQHGASFRHIALTARPFKATPMAAEWVFGHFGRWIRAFGFVPSPRRTDDAPVYDLNKAEWLDWISRGDIFVDDSPKNIQEVARKGIATITIPQPWNHAKGTFGEAVKAIEDLKTL